MSDRLATASVYTLVSVVASVLAGCTAPGPAPVSDRAAARPATRTEQVKPEPPRASALQMIASSNGLHTIQRGDTLYAIAFVNNLDPRDLASWNTLESPDLIRAGQVLRLTAPLNAVQTVPLDDAPPVQAKPLAEALLVRTPQAVLLPYSDANWAQASGETVTPPVVAAPPKPEPVAKSEPAAPLPTGTVERWLWPSEGALAGRFGGAGGKGIDIVGARHTPVKAVASGKVVYNGSGLRGYGRLLIVKHAGEFLSAYAHNDSVLVKEGDAVSAGQKIALMGDSDADRVKLHFEIRRYGKPLDPLDYLPERS
ncbi:MAG: peptidoglycan DD-metalloendopeptidase family protein [Thiobacillus sp.]